MAAARRSDRRWYQFSLSSLFWLTTLVAIVFAAGRVFAGQPSDSWVITAGTFLGTFAFVSLVLAGPLLVVIVSDFLKTTVKKVAAVCGVCVFSLLALLVLAVLITGRYMGDMVATLIGVFGLFGGILAWWGVQSLILWWMIRAVRSADAAAKLRRHTWPESVNLPTEDQDPPDA